jgi:hypothetical protein
MISCNTPNGQRKEQYTRPKRNVRIRTTINPMAAKDKTLKKFRIEGTN